MSSLIKMTLLYIDCGSYAFYKALQGATKPYQVVRIVFYGQAEPKGWKQVGPLRFYPQGSKEP